MKTLNRITLALVLAVALVSVAPAQNVYPGITTLSEALDDTTTTFTVGSGTGFTVNGGLLIDNEYMRIRTVSGATITATRGLLATRKTPHVIGSTVYAGPANYFGQIDKSGACTSTAELVLPFINVNNGNRYLCTDGQWGKLGVFKVPPTSCTFVSTAGSLATTNTYATVGASLAFVLNSATSAASGTDTLVCDFLPPTEVSTGMGSVLTDIVVALGSQTVAPTSVGTSTLSTVSFPTPTATTQTASVVTPVAAGGTVTTVGPTTTFATVTTAGAFLTFSHNYATPVQLNTDLQLVHYTFPILQSAASAMVVNTPGLWVHYQKR